MTISSESSYVPLDFLRLPVDFDYFEYYERDYRPGIDF